MCMTECLIENKANIHTADEQSRTALHWAAVNNHVEIARYLAHHGADVNIVAKNGETALIYATARGKLGCG